MPIYEALYRELRRRGCTQLDAAREVGVSKQVMHNWLTARHVPSGDHVNAVAGFLGVTSADVAAMSQHSHRVDRIAELERVQEELVREIATIKSVLATAGYLANGLGPIAKLPRSRRALKPEG